jgi:hypothetical protein
MRIMALSRKAGFAAKDADRPMTIPGWGSYGLSLNPPPGTGVFARQDKGKSPAMHAADACHRPAVALL